MTRGLLITFEGSEGCGKSTQIALLKERLVASGRDPLLVREPGGTEIGEKIRDLLQFDKVGQGMCSETELLLFCASRAQLVAEVIQPALVQGRLVLCDRFLDSTRVYQGEARGLKESAVEACLALALQGLNPDLTLLLDLDSSEGRRRAKARSNAAEDRMESQTDDFYERVRAGYLKLAAREPDRIKVLNAALAPNALAELIWKEVSRVLSC